MKNKYLFFYLKTGGGHLAPAKSITEFLQRNHADTIETVLVDGFAGTPGFVKHTIEDGYRFCQARAKWFYAFLYVVNKFPPIAYLTVFVVTKTVRPLLRQVILREHPKKIVLFHFFLVKPVLDIVRELGLGIPVITVVTDPYTAHPVWFRFKHQQFIVFSEDVRKYALRQGVAPERVSVFPFAIEEKYTRPLPSDTIAEIKNKLNFSPGKKIVLIMGGSDGMPRGISILKRLIRSNPSAEFAMVCGNNKSLYKKAMDLKSRYSLDSVKIFGYIDFVYELLNVSDIVVTKCGASTFMEILMSGKIPVVNNYIWEQEKGNVDFIEAKRVGIYEKRVRRLPGIINRIIDDANLYLSFTSNIEHASLQNGTMKISQFIVNFQNG